MLENFRYRFWLIFHPKGLFYIWRDIKVTFRFLRNKNFILSFKERLRLLKDIYIVTLNIDCPHTQDEIFAYITKILTTPNTIKGCFVEAGCYKGGSTVKFSLAIKLAKRKLVVFDSFEGIPKNLEPSEKGLFGGSATFREGDYKSDIEEVRANIQKYGYIDKCELIKGWFEDTMQNFKKPIAGIYLDVDLESSTRTCLKYLYPLLEPGGYLLSQDGHLPRIVNLFNNDKFWEDELGFKKPRIKDLGKKKLIEIQKVIR